MSKKILLFTSLIFAFVSAQSYNDRRCRCVCSSPSDFLNTSSSTNKKLFIVDVHPTKCTCVGAILPQVNDILNGRSEEFCTYCDCKYETRNTTIIKVVVIMVIWVLTMLLVYMGFLIMLDALTRKSKSKMYKEITTTDETHHLLQGELED